MKTLLLRCVPAGHRPKRNCLLRPLIGYRYSLSIYVMINCRMLNTLRPRQNGRHFPDDLFKWIFLNKNVWISINISLEFVPRGPVNNISTLVQVMARRRPGDKPLSEPVMVRVLTHMCGTRLQWVNLNPISILWDNSLLPCPHIDHISYSSRDSLEQLITSQTNLSIFRSIHHSLVSLAIVCDT